MLAAGSPVGSRPSTGVITYKSSQLMLVCRIHCCQGFKTVWCLLPVCMALCPWSKPAMWTPPTVHGSFCVLLDGRRTHAKHVTQTTASFAAPCIRQGSTLTPHRSWSCTLKPCMTCWTASAPLAQQQVSQIGPSGLWLSCGRGCMQWGLQYKQGVQLLLPLQ